MKAEIMSGVTGSPEMIKIREVATRVSFDVAVVGAGIIGSSVAYWLTRRKAPSVLLVEGAHVASAASGLNAGTLLVQNKTGELLRYCIQANEVWKELAGVLDSSLEYRQKDGLLVSYGPEEDQLVQELVAEQVSLGLGTRYVYGRELREEFPFLGRDVTSVSLSPSAAHANPLKAAALLSRQAHDGGACVVSGARVTRIDEAGSRYLLVTTQGNFTAERVVIAAGAWSLGLCRELGYEYPVEVFINQCHVSDRSARVLRHVIGAAAGNLTLKQHDSRHVIIGGGWQGIGEPSSNTREVSLASMIGNVRQAVRAVPLLAGLRLLRSWSGFEAKTPDRLPLIGELPGAPGVHLAVSGNVGFQLGPLLGRTVAQALIGEPDHQALQAFGLGRFCEGPERKAHSEVPA